MKMLLQLYKKEVVKINKEIYKRFKKGHKGEKTMEVAEAGAEIQIALEDLIKKLNKLLENKKVG